MKKLFIVPLLLISISACSQVNRIIKVKTPVETINIINANDEEVTVKKISSYTVLENNEVSTVEVYQEVKSPTVNTNILPKNVSKINKKQLLK